MFFDAHAHIASSPNSYRDISAVLKRVKEAGLIKVVDTGIDLKTSEEVLDLHFRYPDFVIPTIGLQPELLIPGSDIYNPHMKRSNVDQFIVKLKSLYVKGKGKYKAIGECGLDYYWIENSNQLTDKQQSNIKVLQKILFKMQIDFALEVGLPLVVHSRGAEEECLKIINEKLKNKNSKVMVLFHSFTGGLKIARGIFEEGSYISFNNILSYPRANEIREIFKLAWSKYQKQVLSETDSPYLPPQHKRGEICDPSDVVFVVEKMAEIVDETTSEIAAVIVRNAQEFYKV